MSSSRPLNCALMTAQSLNSGQISHSGERSDWDLFESFDTGNDQDGNADEFHRRSTLAKLNTISYE